MPVVTVTAAAVVNPNNAGKKKPKWNLTMANSCRRCVNYVHSRLLSSREEEDINTTIGGLKLNLGCIFWIYIDSFNLFQKRDSKWTHSQIGQSHLRIRSFPISLVYFPRAAIKESLSCHASSLLWLFSRCLNAARQNVKQKNRTTRNNNNSKQALTVSEAIWLPHTFKTIEWLLLLLL